MPPVGFEPTISASEFSKVYELKIAGKNPHRLRGYGINWGACGSDVV
jgi:hypothetical protein